MGVRLGEDIIATPTQGSGIITLPPSLLTLGGRQYRTQTLARTISADVVLAANTLYFVYCQVVSGSPALRISTSVPSAYVLSNPTAKLVTAFYSNNLTTPSFAAFVNIDGVPRTEWWFTNNTIPAALTSTGSNPAFGTMDTNLYRLRRDGEEVVGEWNMRMTAQGSPGTGSYLIVFPFPILDSYYKSVPGTNQSGTIGTMHMQEFTPSPWRGIGSCYIPNLPASGFAVCLGLVNGSATLAGDWGGSGIVPFGGSGQTERFLIEYRYKVNGWSNTPLLKL